MVDVEQPPTLPRYKTSEKYRVVKQISKGSYGDVFLAERIDDSQLVCLKQVDLDFLSPSESAGCLSEVRLLQSLPPHQNVVKCHDAFWGDMSECGGGSRLVLVLEYGDVGDLETLIQAESLHQSELWVETALNIFAQITLGLAFLHQQHVLHRDIKSKNVFRFSDGRVVIGDFGTSKSLAHTAAMANTLVGSPLYMSPELLDDQPYSFSSDIWSLGCLLYELFAGRTPFVAASYPAVVLKITKGAYDPLSPTVPTEVQDAVARMLSLDPSQRPTAEELLQMGIVQSRLCEAKTPEDAPDATDNLTAVATMAMSTPSDTISDVRVDVETVESPGNEPMLLPPPPPSALSAAMITAPACYESHVPLPQPPASKAQPKTRKDGPQVFPTTRASIADILSKERLNVHKERSHAHKTQSRGAKFLSCVPVMETERPAVPRIRRAPKSMTSTVPANVRAPVPPENMLIIGTKVSSVKPTKPMAAKR